MKRISIIGCCVFLITTLSMVKVQIILFDGFDELGAIAPFEVIKSAMAIDADVQAELVTLNSSMKVIASHGMQVQANPKLEINQELDILVVPGGGWGNRATQGAWAEAQRGEIPAAISRLYQKLPAQHCLLPENSKAISRWCI